MSAGTNVARPSTPIDLETVRRNLREVMTNLQLLENGENVRVEDLIRQARENLERNRHFILQNIVQNRGNRNQNGVFAINLERMPMVYHRQPVAADERPPARENGANNEGLVNHNQGANQRRTMHNGGGNNPAQQVADPFRARTERNEQDANDFRQNRVHNAGHVQRNLPNTRANMNEFHIRRFHATANNNRLNRNDNGNHGARDLGCLEANNARRPAGGPFDPNISFLRAPIPPIRYNNNLNMPLEIRDNRFVQNLKDSVAFLQARLARLEEDTFQDGIQDRMRPVRQGRQQYNAANANCNLLANNHRLNPPNAEANQEIPRQPSPLPLWRDVQQLIPNAMDPPVNQRNSPVKRLGVAESSGSTNDSQGGNVKRLKTGENLPGRSSDPVTPLLQRNDENYVAGQGITQHVMGSTPLITIIIDNFELEDAPRPKHKKHSKKSTHKDHLKKATNRLNNTVDDERPGPSRESTIARNAERDDNENRTEDNRTGDSVVENRVNQVQLVENTHQDPNDDVIIVSAFFPVKIKVEKTDDDNNGRNNRHNLENAARNRAAPPAFPGNDNGARQEAPMLRPEVVIREILERALRRPAHVPRAVQGAEARARLMNANARVRRDIPGIGGGQFFSVRDMATRLQTFCVNEVRALNRRNLHQLENECEDTQLQIIQTYVRLRRELREVMDNSERLGLRCCRVTYVDGKVVIGISIVGPPGTAYDGASIGLFVTMIGRHYSMVRMSHRIWHPNMSPFTGVVLPKYPWENWTLFKIVACVRRLLIIPELENITHDVVARQFQNHREIFNRTAQHWTSVYGRGGRNEHLAVPEYAELLDTLVEEGIPKERALHLLSKNNWDIEKAMEEIG